MPFIQLQPADKKWRDKDKQLSRIAAWYDTRGSRYLLLRCVAKDRYDLRIVVQSVTRVERQAIPHRQVILAARTLGIMLDQEVIERLTSSGATTR
jgi:hypothetical protein